MKNKLIIELIVPAIEESYSVYLPINKRVGEVISLLLKAISEFNYFTYTNQKDIGLYNSQTGLKYSPNDLIAKTDIKNGSRLVLI